MLKKKIDIKKLKEKNTAQRRTLVQAWITPTLHKKAKTKMKKDNISMSAFIRESLELYLN